MTPLQIAETIANGLAAVAAWVLVRRERRHAPLAALLTFGVLSAVAHELLAHAVGDERPIAGEALAFFHADQARLLGWHLAVAGVAGLVFARRLLPLLLAWVAWALFLAALPSVPLTRTATTLLYSLAAIVPLAVGVWALLTVRGRWTTSQRVAGILCAGELGALVTYLRGPYTGAAWTPAQCGYLVAFGAAVTVQVGALWNAGRRR